MCAYASVDHHRPRDREQRDGRQPGVGGPRHLSAAAIGTAGRGLVPRAARRVVSWRRRGWQYPVVTWSLVVPVKRLAVAKSRLGGGFQPGLALAFAQDTVTAALATPSVGRVIVMTDDSDVRTAVIALGGLARPDVARGGLNEAVRRGAAYAVGIAGPHPVAALPSDLPALTAAQLQAALVAAALHPRAFVPDALGTGTTLLSGRDGSLDPRYGPGSAEEHARAGATRLDGEWPGLRRDVDTLEDLLAAHVLGLGGATERMLATSSLLCGTTP